MNLAGALDFTPDVGRLALYASGAAASSGSEDTARELREVAESFAPVIRVVKSGAAAVRRMARGTLKPSDPRPPRTLAEARRAQAALATLTASLGRVAHFFEIALPAVLETVPKARARGVQLALRSVELRRLEAVEAVESALEAADDLLDVFLLIEARLDPENAGPAIPWEKVRSAAPTP